MLRIDRNPGHSLQTRNAITQSLKTVNTMFQFVQFFIETTPREADLKSLFKTTERFSIKPARLVLWTMSDRISRGRLSALFANNLLLRLFSLDSWSRQRSGLQDH